MTTLEKYNPATLKRLVSSLMYLFNFKNSSELCFLLGYGHAETNEEALSLWVGDMLKTEEEWVEPDHVLGFLVKVLHQDLTRFEEVIW